MPRTSDLHTGDDLSATPRVVVDETIARENIARMAASAHSRGLALRPHAKTHKSLEIARWQLETGGTGITVATVSEGQIFADGGIDDIFIAYPLWVDQALGRRLRVLDGACTLRLGVDSVEAARQLARACPELRAGVLVEVDSGHHRSGVLPAEAGRVARAVADAGLTFAGIFTFPGHGYAPGGREAAAGAEAQSLAEAKRVVEEEGLAVTVVSGGSSPTAALSDPGVLTELRPGVYVFNDAQQLILGSCTAAEIALAVEATVVSVHSDRVVVNAGSKTLGADAAGWTDGYGRLAGHADARITALSEHHGTVVGANLALGERVRIIPNHVCTVVNLADWMVVENGTSRLLPVDARGANT